MIHGLERRARLPRFGIIRLGIKVRNEQGKEYPKETDYFVLPEALRSVFGDRERSLAVLFPSDDVDRVLPTEYTRYAGKLVTLKCDGETFTELPVKGGELTGQCQRAPDEPWKPCPCGARAMGRLNVILPDAPLGIWQVIIGGQQRVADVLMELIVYKQTLGRLTDIPFRLDRVPTEIQVRRDDGTRLARTGWPVHIRCDFTAKDALKLRGVDLLKALPPAEMVETEGEHAAEEANGEESPAPAGGAPGLSASHSPDEPTLERCYQWAQELGVTAKAYELYLRGAYGDHIDAKTLGVQQKKFLKVKGNAEAGKMLKAEIIAGANKASQQGVLA